MIKKEPGKKREFSTGAKKQSAEDKGTPVLMPPDALIDLSKHFEEGGKLHGDRNWEKGIPLSEIMNSLERHIQQEKMGLTDEHHDRAIAWNALVYLAMKLRVQEGVLPQELDDIPKLANQPKIKILTENDFIISEDLRFGWYIFKEGAHTCYLHKDLTLQEGTGFNGHNCGEAPGYYKSKAKARKYLQNYLNVQNAKPGDVVRIS